MDLNPCYALVLYENNGLESLYSWSRGKNAAIWLEKDIELCSFYKNLLQPDLGLCNFVVAAFSLYLYVNVDYGGHRTLHGIAK